MNKDFPIGMIFGLIGFTLILFIERYRTLSKKQNIISDGFTLSISDTKISYQLIGLNALNSKTSGHKDEGVITNIINTDSIRNIFQAKNGSLLINSKNDKEQNMMLISNQLKEFENLKKELNEISEIRMFDNYDILRDSTHTIAAEGVQQTRRTELKRASIAFTIIFAAFCLIYRYVLKMDWTLIGQTLGPTMLMVVFIGIYRFRHLKTLYQELKLVFLNNYIILDDRKTISVFPFSEDLEVTELSNGKFIFRIRRGAMQVPLSPGRTGENSELAMTIPIYFTNKDKLYERLKERVIIKKMIAFI